MGLLLCLAFAGLGYRLVDLQVLRHKELSALAQLNTQHEFLLEPRRGDILDAKGNLLATSVFMKQVFADPTVIDSNQVEVAHVLAPLLQTNENLLVQELTPTLHPVTLKDGTVTNKYSRRVCLAKRVPFETWAKIRSAMTNLDFGVSEKLSSRAQKSYYNTLRNKAIFCEDEQLRFYPNQSLAAHVLGYVATQEKQFDDRNVTEIVGKEGIERSFDTRLAGVRGWRVTETDHKKQEVVTLREQDVEPRDGDSVVLTIDSVIQHIVETALAAAMEKHEPISASGIVVRPSTGEILAMATLPGYDPNLLNKAGMQNTRNRVIMDYAEPGSTFKIIVVSGALNDGVVRLTDCFDCEHGLWFYAGRRLHDHEPYGVLSVEQIITKSSNIGAAKVGLKLGENRLYDYIRSYGFGQATGIPLLGETPGLLRNVTNWNKVAIAQIPMGQGIAVSRLQMTMAMCAIANKGILMRPMLVDRLEDCNHKEAKCPPQRVHRVISESTAQLMVQALKTVVSSNGTAPQAALEHYTVAGKTGTAQKVENGIYVNKFFSSFVGFFPADNPELCISVTLDEPKQQGHYGGKVAGPVFKQIAEAAANYLNIRPEDGEPSAHPENTAPPMVTPVVPKAIARSQ